MMAEKPNVTNILKNTSLDIREKESSEAHFVVVRNWDRSSDSLQNNTAVVQLIEKVGFSTQILTEVLNKEFSTNIEAHAEYNINGDKTEDIVREKITVNGKPLDLLSVTAYPPAANTNPTEMTQFLSGGEVIFITEGEAELTIANKVYCGTIERTQLRIEPVKKGDLIISTDTPNNWTKVYGSSFSFIYFVGNPNGPQQYKEVPKKKVKIV